MYTIGVDGVDTTEADLDEFERYGKQWIEKLHLNDWDVAFR